MRLLTLAGAWVAGLLVGLGFDLPPMAFYLFLAACAFLALLLRATGRSAWLAVIASMLLLGILRVELRETGGASLSLYNGTGPVTLEGVVVADPEVRGRNVRLIVEGFLHDRPEVKGKVLVWAPPSLELVQRREEPYLRYGDRLRLTGELERPEPFGGFDYEGYLASQGIGSVMSYPHVELLGEGYGSPLLRGVYALRYRLAESLETSLPGEQAALAQAIFLGKRGDISESLTEAFRLTGTSHILAISGLNIAMLMVPSLALGIWLLGRKRNFYLLVPLMVIWVYALLGGFSPSVERAAVMGTVYLVALELGRQRAVFPALALAAAVMAGLDPRVLQDVSFQLSVTAVAGIALLAPPLSQTLKATLARLVGERQGEHPWSAGVMEAVAVGAAATVGSLPLIAFHFHRVSVVGIPVTLVLLPVLPVAVVTAALTSVGGLIHTVLGQVLGWITFVPLGYTTGVVELLGRLPGISISAGQVSGVLVWAYYIVGLGVLLVPRFFPQVRHMLSGLGESLAGREPAVRRLFKERRALLVLPPVLLAGLAFLLWMAVATAPDGRLHVSFLDVGQGDSILIETPSGRQVLVDGGPDPRSVVRLLGERLPFHDRTLDLVVLTHSQEDHLAGLVEVAERYGLGMALVGPGEPDTPLYYQWRKTLAEEGIPVAHALAGQRVPLEEELVLEVLAPSSRPFPDSSTPNENSVVLRLAWGEVSFLLTGDIGGRAEYRLLERQAPLRSTVLKVAHHGSDTSTSPEFLEAVSPAVAVISVAADNEFGHPNPDVLSRLKAQVGDRIYSTAEEGTIELVTDGKRLWMKTEK